MFVKQTPPNEYSAPLVSQHESKMEPKMEPRQQRPTLTKHAPAWTDCMSTTTTPGSFILAHFLGPQKNPKANIITRF